MTVLKSRPRGAARTARAAAIALGATGLLVLTACGGGSSTASSTTSTAAAGSTSTAASSGAAGASSYVSQADIDAAKATLIDPSALTVCTHLSYKPFQFTDGDKVVGFDVDLLDVAAANLGLTQKIVDTPFEGIKSGDSTATGQCDAAAAAMSITPERQQVMLFSEPYFDANQALVVPEASTVTTLADLRGKRIGAQSGTTGLDYLTANKAANGYEIVEYQDFPSQSDALQTGQIDAGVNDIPVWNEAIKANSGVIKVAAQFDTGDKYGVGMKLGAEALKRVIDGSIEQAKADGRYAAMYEKWIGTAPPAATSGSGSATASTAASS